MIPSHIGGVKRAGEATTKTKSHHKKVPKTENEAIRAAAAVFAKSPHHTDESTMREAAAIFGLELVPDVECTGATCNGDGPCIFS